VNFTSRRDIPGASAGPGGRRTVLPLPRGGRREGVGRDGTSREDPPHIGLLFRRRGSRDVPPPLPLVPVPLRGGGEEGEGGGRPDGAPASRGSSWTLRFTRGGRTGPEGGGRGDGREGGRAPADVRAPSPSPSGGAAVGTGDRGGGRDPRDGRAGGRRRDARGERGGTPEPPPASSRPSPASRLSSAREVSLWLEGRRTRNVSNATNRI
jgi:hypothetical protein